MKRKKIHNSTFSFNNVPTINRPRTRFPLNYDILTTLNVGDLVPYEVTEVYPGDTFNIHDSFVCRPSSAYLKPVMDNLYLQQHYFFVPYRTIWQDFTKFITGSEGDGEPDDWNSDFESQIPCIPAGSVIPEGSIGDYLGLPTKIELGADVSVLPFRAVAKIYNEWFRDENVINSLVVQQGDFDDSELPNDGLFGNIVVNDSAVSNYTGMLPKVGKFKDYFTSLLPKPQKGDPVSFNIGGLAPVVTGDNHPENLGTKELKLIGHGISSWGNPLPLYFAKHGGKDDGYLITSSVQQTGLEGIGYLKPENLWADMSNVNPFDVNDVRLAFALQKIKERSARSGSRFTEYILSAFGVTSADASLQRSQYLGGKRTPLGYVQVAQTSQGSGESSLADVGAYGISVGKDGFNKGFTEHGLVISFVSIKYHHTYQQGIPSMFLRKDRFDFYDPAFMNVGEQPVKTCEIFGSDSEHILGYKGAWDELRVIPSHVTGQMRSNSATSQDIYHYGDVYENAPSLVKDFIEETPDFVDRTLAVPHTSQNMFLFNVHRSGSMVRVLPMYSVPSLVDHN